MSSQDTRSQTDWLDASKAASEALAASRTIGAVQRAHNHLMLLLLTAFAKSAPAEVVDQLIDEIERVRDLSGPAGNAAGEVFAAAASTLERFARRE